MRSGGVIPLDRAAPPSLPPSGLDGLLSPLRIRGMRLRNRFVVPSMQRGASDAGAPPPALAEYYGRFAEGGFALVLSESCAIDHPSASHKTTCVRMLPETLAPWRECVARVRAADGHMLIQLWHEGALRIADGTGVHPEAPTLSPSGLLNRFEPVGRAMTADEMEAVKQSFVRSAKMAQDIGAAGVELHAAHGYLLDQFLWADTNRRTDGYGGDDMARRVRFPAEVVAAIREAAGEEFVISLRFSQWKGNHGRKRVGAAYDQARIAADPAELAVMLGALRAAGVDIFHVSSRRFHQPEWAGSDLSLAGWTRRSTDATVLAVGSVGMGMDVVESLYEGMEADREEAQRMLAASIGEASRRFSAGEFDLLAVGRASIGDQAWVNKVASGRLGDIDMFNRDALVSIVRGIG